MRINHFLAQAGLGSRRFVEKLVVLGSVKLNGQVVRNLGTQVDPKVDTVEVNGEVAKLSAEKKIVYLLNKPKGVITTAIDPEGRKTVLDFVPKSPLVFPCGRLDQATTGLVVLTNDGELCQKLTHPSFETKKEYIVEGSSKNIRKGIQQLKNGINLKDGQFKTDEITLLKQNQSKATIQVAIHDGRNHIVRRAFAAVGIEVTNLKRTKMGQYELGEIEEGEYTVFQ